MSKPMAGGHDNGTLLTVREVATYLRISEATVYKWAKGKKIPAIRIGRNWRFLKQAVEEWVSQEAAFSAAKENTTPVQSLRLEEV